MKQTILVVFMYSLAWYNSPGHVMAINRVDGWKGQSMGTDTLKSQQHRLTGHRRFWVISVVAMFLLTLIVISTLVMRGRNRAAIMLGLPQNCSIQFDPVVPAQVRSILGEANCHWLFDRPVKVLLRCEDWKPIVLPDLSGLEQVDTLREMEIRPAFISKSQLDRLPAPPSVRKLRMANYLSACSETCVVDAADTEPWKPEFAWEGKDMAFLSRFRNLRELELRALWLRAGVLDVVADLPQLDVLSLNRSDFPSDELPSLRRLRNLRVLTFWRTPKAMRSLESLREMDSLEELTLVGCSHTDAKLLEPLAKLPRLHTLRLDYGSLSDDVWPALATFPHLRILTLSFTNRFAANPFFPDQVTAVSLAQAPKLGGLRDAPGLNHLEWLDIDNEYVYAAETLQALVTSLPKECKVVVNLAHLGKYSSQLPPDIANRLTGDLRPDLEFPVEY